MRVYFIFIVVFCIARSVIAQTHGSDYVVGQSFSIASTAFNDEREIQVFTPEGYETSNKSYPVLYVLDGQRWYLHAVGLETLFSEYKYTPEFIVVGIPTLDSGRFGFFANTSKLIDFLQLDVINFVDNNFRSTNERLLFGWQFAGSFALEAFTHESRLFNAYFAASPIPISDKKLADIEGFITKNPEANSSLFFTSSINEGQVQRGTKRLDSLLLANAPETIDWTYKKLHLEELSSFGHRTTPLQTLYYGLRSYFQDYTLLEFNDIQSYKNLGGFSYVEEYYKNRGGKYGVSSKIPPEGMFFLVRLSLDENHYETFDFFISRFGDDGLFDYTNRGWTSRYAEFYIKHNQSEKAIEIYELLSEKYPNHSKTHERLAELRRKN
ncbi:MAG: alpha/beta hydrolase-fold protein [Bacteroidota bacterium]